MKLPHAKAPTEHVEQIRLMQMVRLHAARFPMLKNLTAIPNGGHRNKAVAGKLKAEGVSRGYPDLLLDWPAQGFHGLRIEIKRQDATPSDTKPEQREWHRRLEDAGYRVEVCKGWEAAWAIIVDYLGLGVWGVKS